MFHGMFVRHISSCWLFRDQLARLWRLLVLNPSISARTREEIFTTMEVFEAKLRKFIISF